MSDYVKEYYNEMAEHELNRLNNPYTSIEYRSSIYLINKYFIKGKKLIDIGSGPGRYSEYLLNKEIQLDLLDLSEESLKIAQKNNESLGYRDCRYFPMSATEIKTFKAESYDNVLCLGPMYHLNNKQDRLDVLNGLYHILKPGGRALIAYINSYGVFRSSITEFPESFVKEDYLPKGIKGNLALSHEESFTEAFFTNKEHAQSEINQTPFNILSIAGAESFLSGLQSQVADLYKNDNELYQHYLTLASENCELSHYRETTEHIIFVVEKK